MQGFPQAVRTWQKQRSGEDKVGGKSSITCVEVLLMAGNFISGDVGLG